MKTFFKTTLIILFAFQNTNAQNTRKGIYFSLNSGYNFEAGKSVDYLYDNFSKSSTDNSASNQVTYHVKKISFGGGAKFGVVFGYQFNEFFSSEIAVDYLLGGKNELNSTYRGKEYINQTLNSRMLQIKPTFVLSANFKKINPYTKIGLVIGSGKIEYITDTKTLSGQLVNEKFLLNGGLAIGYNAGVGLLYIISKKTNLFGEVSIINLSYSPTNGKRTQYTVDGVDVLKSGTISENEFEFKETYDFVNPADQDLNKPTIQGTTTYSFSSIGLNIGIRYNL